MSKRFKFCIHCRRTITESEINRGEFVKTRFGMLCPVCATRLEEEPEPAKPVEKPAPAPEPEPAKPTPPAPPPTAPARTAEKPLEPVPTVELPPRPSGELSEAINHLSQQVERIQRSLMFEKSSSWNVMASVAQCVAFGLLLLAVLNWLDGPGNLLLAALLMQVMALTFFVKAK